MLFKGKLMMCGFDSIEIVSQSENELLHYLKTSADIGKSLTYHESQEILIAFRSLNQDSVIIYNLETYQERQIAGFNNDLIQSLSFNSKGDKIVIVNKNADFIQVRSTKTGELLDLFHRGVKSANVIHIIFSPNDKYLSVLSNRYTQHIFQQTDISKSNDSGLKSLFQKKVPDFALTDYLKSKSSFAVHHIENLKMSNSISDQCNFFAYKQNRDQAKTYYTIYDTNSESQKKS